MLTVPTALLKVGFGFFCLPSSVLPGEMFAAHAFHIVENGIRSI